MKYCSNNFNYDKMLTTYYVHEIYFFSKLEMHRVLTLFGFVKCLSSH